MRNKILCSLLICTLVCASVGCGKGEVVDTPVPDTQEVVEETTEAESDSETVGYVIPSSEEESSEEVVEEIEFNEEYALGKVKRALNAYEAILTSHNDYSINICRFIDTCAMDSFEDLATSDGFALAGDVTEDRVRITISTYIRYFDEYINNDGDYYDIAEYVKNHTKDELLKEAFYVPAESYKCDEYYLQGIYAVPTMIYLHPNTLSTSGILYKEDIEKSDYVKQVVRFSPDDIVEFEYLVPIIIDDKDSGLCAVFDKDCNLVNILGSEDIAHKGVSDLVTMQ